MFVSIKNTLHSLARNGWSLLQRRRIRGGLSSLQSEAATPDRDAEEEIVLDRTAAHDLLERGGDLEKSSTYPPSTQDYPEGSSRFATEGVPPPIPLLVPPRHILGSEFYRFAVLVRSHVVDEKFDHLWRDLNGPNRRFDVFPLLDQAALGANFESIERKYPGTIWNHPDRFARFGLNQKASGFNMLWLHGDFSMYVALVDKPDYDYYIMIDYDVHFTKGGTDYINKICDCLSLMGDNVIDGVGLEFKSQPTLRGVTTDWPHFMDWEFFAAASGAFPQVFHFYFPFVVLSRRALIYVLAQRQLEAARRTPADKVVICEAFVPSSLMAAGLKCMDVNNLLPGSYELDTMGLQHLRSDRLAGQPLSFAIRNPQLDVEMIHAVYSQEQFLSRNLNQRSGSRFELEWFLKEIEANFAASLNVDLLADYVARAREKIAAW